MEPYADILHILFEVLLSLLVKVFDINICIYLNLIFILILYLVLLLESISALDTSYINIYLLA